MRLLELGSRLRSITVQIQTACRVCLTKLQELLFAPVQQDGGRMSLVQHAGVVSANTRRLLTKSLLTKDAMNNHCNPNSESPDSGPTDGSSPRLVAHRENSGPANLKTSETVRMWRGGPLRQFIAGDQHPGGSFIRYRNLILVGFAGSYLCDVCRRPAGGLYCVTQLKKWVQGNRQLSKVAP